MRGESKMEPRSIRTSKMQSLNSQHFLFFTVITLKSFKIETQRNYEMTLLSKKGKKMIEN